VLHERYVEVGIVCSFSDIFWDIVKKKFVYVVDDWQGIICQKLTELTGRRNQSKFLCYYILKTDFIFAVTKPQVGKLELS